MLVTINERFIHRITHIFNISLYLSNRNVKMLRQQASIGITFIINFVMKPYIFYHSKFRFIGQMNNPPNYILPQAQGEVNRKFTTKGKNKMLIRFYCIYAAVQKRKKKMPYSVVEPSTAKGIFGFSLKALPKILCKSKSNKAKDGLQGKRD